MGFINRNIVFLGIYSVEYDNLANKALIQLKKDILDGRYQPGEKLALSRLRENYDVGGSPLREALSGLLAEGLVTAESQRGFRVSPVSVAELQDIYEARAQLESLLGALALERGDDQWEAGVVGAAHSLFKYGNIDQAADIPVGDWEERHHAFHSAIVVGCGVGELLAVRATLYEKAARYRNLWLSENTRQSAAFDANLSDHQKLMQAVLDRDVQTLKDLLYDHILVPVHIIKQRFL